MHRLRKRAREEETAAEGEGRQPAIFVLVPPGYNPVYPYDPVRDTGGLSIPMPPFYNNVDFAEDPIGTLVLRCVNPLERTILGLGLKLGSGLSLDSQGALTARSQHLTALAPLVITDEVLSLNISTPLRIENNLLKVNYLKPLYETTDNELTVRYGPSLEVSQDGENQLQVRTTAPITKNQDGVGLVTGAAMQVIGGALAVKYVFPLDVTADSSLTVNNNNITHVYGSRASYPLQLTVFNDQGTAVSGNFTYTDLLFIKTGPVSTMRLTMFANNRTLAGNYAQFKISFNDTTGALISDNACQGIMGYLTGNDSIQNPSPVPLRSFLPIVRSPDTRQTYVCTTYFGEGGWQEGSNNGTGHCSVNYSTIGGNLVFNFRAVCSATSNRKLNFNFSVSFYTN